MKRKIFLKAALATAALMFTLITSSNAYAQLPDLRVAAINTPGGLCQGNTNKIQATIQNSQYFAASAPILVILRVQFPNGGQGSYQTTIPTGIGPNGTQPAWFNNVSLPNTGNYSFTVIVDPQNQIAETVENNNSRSLSRSVTSICGQAPAVQTYILTVRVYKVGTWSAGQGQWIQGATVTLSNPNDSGFATVTATTNSSGQAIFNNVPASKPGKPYTISASKSGCQPVQGTTGSTQSFLMGAYNTTRNLPLNCP